MAHKIAASSCWTEPFAWWVYPGPSPSSASLYVAFLNAQGNPYVFQQIPPNGVWSGNVTAPGSPAFPLSVPANVPFTAIAGVNNYLVALGKDGNLYASVYSQSGPAPQPGDWSAFTALLPLDSVFGPGGQGTAPISDFSVIALAPSSLVIAAAFEDTTRGLAGFYSYNLNLQDYKTNLAQAVQNNPGGWAEIDVLYAHGAKGASAPALGLIYEGWNPTVAFIGLSAAVSPSTPALTAYGSTDGHTWTQGLLPAGVNQPTSIMIAPGNPAGTLQATMLVNGQPMLFYSTDGSKWSYYGDLIPPKVVNPPTFIAAAAGAGNGGNLQLVGIGPTVYPPNLPYLIWQNTSGAWSLYPSGAAGGGYIEWTCLANDFAGNPSTSPTDLAIGLGFCDRGPALQVCYLGADGNIYISWQDPEGVWRWYPGLSGSGLP